MIFVMTMHGRVFRHEFPDELIMAELLLMLSTLQLLMCCLCLVYSHLLIFNSILS